MDFIEAIQVLRKNANFINVFIASHYQNKYEFITLNPFGKHSGIDRQMCCSLGTW